ncbi:autotransporter assembly complex protein TamA [Novosphingobium sp. 9]|uniref:autotransporter assembly complex protein TamA n=1 Tax=Novosphingobium sp. 9 TaxID=2025349 RepID=UPI0021B65081|nr:BamA/TamA family outer membrane protein [Novosphingobium sp. 9]
MRKAFAQARGVQAGSLTLVAVLALASVPAIAQDTAKDDAAKADTAQQPSAPSAAPDAAPDGAQAQDADVSLEAGKVPVPAAPADVPLPKVDPVITDQEFNGAVPALSPQDDPEMDKPLESIGDFESRMAREQAAPAADGQAAKAQSAAAASPATAAANASASQGTSADVAANPSSDPELSQPLPALNSFEVTPVQFTAKDENAKQPEVRYVTVLKGLENADEETDTNMASQFKSLSALDKGHGKAANLAMLSARLTEDSKLMETILASQGWYSPVVRTRIDPADEAGGPLKASVTVTPGTRYTFASIDVQAGTTIPADLIAKNVALKVGQPIVADRVQGAEAQIAVVLPENGYPFAKVGQRDILLDEDTGKGDYTLPVDVGARGSFGGFTTEGDLAFDAKHVAVLSRFKRGELYDSRKVDDLRKALVATSLFSTVTVEPKDSGEKAPDGTEYVTLDVKQDAGPSHTIAAQLGYATGEGATAEATWTHRNIFPPEGALIAHVLAGTLQQGAGLTFRRSNAGKRDRTFELVAEAFHNDYDAYSAYTGRIAAKISRDSTNIWQKKITYAYGVEVLGTAETDYEPSTQTRDRHTFYVAGVSGQIGYDTSDNLMNPTKGYRVTLFAEPETTLRSGFNPYVRSQLDVSGYQPFGDSFVLAGRLRLATIQGSGLYDIAPSRRLYAGGGGSVRGYAYQSLGEQAPDGKPVGGRSLNEASVEARYRFGNYGVVAFVDAGQAYAQTTPQFNDLRYGVGIGGRFYTNFGPFRLDVATPIDRRPGEGRLNIYVSIGQAF